MRSGVPWSWADWLSAGVIQGVTGGAFLTLMLSFEPDVFGIGNWKGQMVTAGPLSLDADKGTLMGRCIDGVFLHQNQEKPEQGRRWSRTSPMESFLTAFHIENCSTVSLLGYHFPFQKSQ